MDIRALFMGVSFAFIWSSAFTAARIILQSAPALYLLSFRFLIAGIIAISIAYIMGQRLDFTKSQWRAIAIFGICQNAIYLGLFFIAMQSSIEASLASIIASAMPLFVALFTIILLKRKTSKIITLGLITGFAGVGIIMINRISGDINLFGLICCIIGVIALAIATLSVQTATTGDNILLVVGFQMLVGSVVLFIPAIIFETWTIHWSPIFLSVFAYVVLVPGIFATYIWFKLVNRIGATKAATFHFLNPFFGIAIAAIILEEKITFSDLIGVGIIMIGILIVQMNHIKT